MHLLTPPALFGITFYFLATLNFIYGPYALGYFITCKISVARVFLSYTFTSKRWKLFRLFTSALTFESNTKLFQSPSNSTEGSTQ